MNDFYLIAEVKKAFNSDGSVIIKSFSDFPERFTKLEKIFIDYFGDKKELVIDYVKEIDNNIIVKFSGFNSEEDIQFLLNAKLYVDSVNLFELPEDTFYIHDLIDSEVFIESVFFGKLIDVLKLPNNDVYVIKDDKGIEILIPAVNKFIDRYSEIEKKIYLTAESKMFFEDEN